MSAGAQARGWQGQSRRRTPRFRLQAPLDVKVLRSGIPEDLPGRSLNVCERGLAAVIAGELAPGEIVGVELRLPMSSDSVRTRAKVRYQDKLRCGLEFLGLSAEQRAAIGEWAKRTKADTESERADAELAAVEAAGGENANDSEKEERTPPGGEVPIPRKKRVLPRLMLSFVLILAAAAVFWWKWNRGWKELESGLSGQEASFQLAKLQVPAEVMQKLLVHRVEPLYPPEAKRQGLQGVIALDVVVGQDGSVLSMRALNGPDILARAAMDALRWWRFDPYRLNGEPTVVETTLAVEFKR